LEDFPNGFIPMVNKLNRTIIVVLVLIIAQLLSTCVPILVGTATVTAIDVALDRRTVGRNIDDNALEFKIRKDILLDRTLGRGVNISVTSINGIVLLTGEVMKDKQRQQAESIARSYQETRQLVNEIALSGTTNINSRANDAWITSKVKAKLLRGVGIRASNIKVVTERSSVYLLGIVTHVEGDTAVDIAKSVRGVTHIYKVFEYMII